jgi:nucleotide-binding universal stress UspA family protein
MEKPSDILHEEVLVSRKFSVLVPVSEERQVRTLGKIGAMIASQNNGEVMALYIQKVPHTLSLEQGRNLIMNQRRHLLEKVIEVAKEREVPVHTMIRLGRNVAESVRKTALENASDLIVMGWPGTSGQAAGRPFHFGSVIDPIVDNPPTDVAVVRYHEGRPLDKINSILVAIAGGPNSRRSIEMAVTLAIQARDTEPRVILFSVVPCSTSESARVRMHKDFERLAEEFSYYPHLERKNVEIPTGTNEDIARCILQEAENHDLIVIGAKKEGLFENILIGGISEMVADQARVPVIMVKRRSGLVHNWLRQTVLEPTTGTSVKRNNNDKKKNGDGG